MVVSCDELCKNGLLEARTVIVVFKGANLSYDNFVDFIFIL